MEYYLSLDGGGTKTHFLLFDSRFCPVAFVSDGPLNNTFETFGEMRAVLERGILACRKAIPEVTELRRAYLSMPCDPGFVAGVISEYWRVGETISLLEGDMSLLGGLCAARGGVVLSGTGSGAFWMDGETRRNVGGWGYLLGDEGSACDIGRQGMIAAIRAAEGRGPATRMGEYLLSAFAINRLWELVNLVYSAPSPRRMLAAAAPVLSAAARGGDTVALDIFYRAGRELGLQCRALFLGEPPSGAWFTLSGSAWKGCGKMYDGLRESIPWARVELPCFEPVMGGVVAERLRLEKADSLSEKQKAELLQKFPGQRYIADWIGEGASC